MRVAFSVATGLWPVRPTSSLVEERLTEPWLQATSLAICAANSKHSGGMIGKIRSTRLDGINDIKIKPPTLQQSSQKVSGDISRNAERSRSEERRVGKECRERGEGMN